MVYPGKIFAEIDATGFEDRYCTPYYTWRDQIRCSYTKLSAGSDIKTQLICAVVIQHHLISYDTKHFPLLFSQMVAITLMSVMVLDRDYDAEPVHQMIRDENIISVIPRPAAFSMCCFLYLSQCWSSSSSYSYIGCHWFHLFGSPMK